HSPHFHMGPQLARFLIEAPGLGVADRGVERGDRGEHDHLALGLAQLHRLQAIVHGGEVGSVGTRLYLGAAQRDRVALEIDRTGSIGHEAPPSERIVLISTWFRERSTVYKGRLSYHRRAPKWRNWQTRTTQNRVPVRVCGFDSHLRHHFQSGAPSRVPQGERA